MNNNASPSKMSNIEKNIIIKYLNKPDDYEPGSAMEKKEMEIYLKYKTRIPNLKKFIGTIDATRFDM